MKSSKCYSYKTIIEAGYKIVKETDLSLPIMWLEGNSYKFSTKIILREPVPMVKKEECLFIKIS